MSIKQTKIPTCIFTHFVKPSRWGGAKIRVGECSFVTSQDYIFKYDNNKSYDQNHIDAAEIYAEECGVEDTLIMTKVAPTARIRVFIPINRSDAARIVGQKKKKA